MSNDVTQDDLTALRSQIAAMNDRLAALEASARPLAAVAADTADYVGAYGAAMLERVRQGMDAQSSDYGLGVSSVVTQVGRKGSKGTAFSIVTIDKADDLPTEAIIADRVARAAPLVQDPLAMRIFRSMLERRFAGKPMRCSAAEIATALNDTPERVETALLPLVANRSLHRALASDGTVEYEWDGNNHVVMAILFQNQAA